MWLIVFGMVFVLVLLARRAGGQGREVRRLTRAVEERDREIAELRDQLWESQSRLEAIRPRLQQLERLLKQFEDRPASGVGHLRLDSRGRLLEEGQ